MCPRSEDQPLPAASRALQARVVARRGQRIRIVPRRHVHTGGAAVAVMPALGADAELLPELVECAVRPLVEQIGFVARVMSQRRMAGPPRHAGEPLADVLARQRRPHQRIGFCLRRHERVLERPGRLLQLERAGLADARAPRIDEATAVQHLRHQPRRIEATQRGLGMRGVREAHGADAAVAPGLLAQPGAGVVAVLAVGQVFDEAALRAVAAARVLIHDRIAVRGEIRGKVRARRRCAIGSGDLAAAGFAAAVRRAFDDDRVWSGAVRKVEVGGEADAVAHGDHAGGGRHRVAPLENRSMAHDAGAGAMRRQPRLSGLAVVRIEDGLRVGRWRAPAVVEEPGRIRVPVGRRGRRSLRRPTAAPPGR